MVKHTQTIRWQIADELLECIWPFCEIGTERVIMLSISWTSIGSLIKCVRHGTVIALNSILGEQN